MSAISAVTLTPSAGGMAGRVGLARQLQCGHADASSEGDVVELEWELHPTQQPLGDHNLSAALGAVVFNSAILVLVCIVCAVAAWVSSRFGTKGVAGGAARLRLPGLLYIPFVILYQGIVFAAAAIMWRIDQAPWLVPVAVLSLALCFLSPALLWWLVLRRSILLAHVNWQHDVAVNGPVKKCTHMVNWFFYGRGSWEWHGSEASSLFLKHTHLIFDMWRENARLYGVAELALALFLGCTGALPTSSLGRCIARNCCLCGVMAVWACLLLCQRPYITPFENLLFPLVHCGTALALLLPTLGSIAILASSLSSAAVDLHESLSEVGEWTGIAVVALNFSVVLRDILKFIKFVWTVLRRCISRRLGDGVSPGEEMVAE